MTITEELLKTLRSLVDHVTIDLNVPEYEITIIMARKAIARAEEEIEAERALMAAAEEMLDGMREDDEKGVPF